MFWTFISSFIIIPHQNKVQFHDLKWPRPGSINSRGQSETLWLLGLNDPRILVDQFLFSTVRFEHWRNLFEALLGTDSLWVTLAPKMALNNHNDNLENEKKSLLYSRSGNKNILNNGRTLSHYPQSKTTCWLIEPWLKQRTICCCIKTCSISKVNRLIYKHIQINGHLAWWIKAMAITWPPRVQYIKHWACAHC